ncbi:hypothetical protein [uncultured Friedmanniella sp.]|uniref:hypothetical protein n=1 Tax=uncultured Friedmanniella sp. TaxID=335381 RepID=UPI0035CC873B
MAEFDRYLASPDADVSATSYRRYGLWLSDGERDQLSRELEALVDRYASGPPSPGRRRHLLTASLFPTP